MYEACEIIAKLVDNKKIDGKDAVKTRLDAEIKYFGEYKSEIKCV